MKKLVLAPDVNRRRHSRYAHPVLAAILGIGSGLGLAAGAGLAMADDTAVVPAEGTTQPIIVTKSMKKQALKDAAAGVRGEAPAAPAASDAASAPPAQAPQPTPGAGDSK